MNKQEWRSLCARLLDVMWSGWEQFYPGHKCPEEDICDKLFEEEAE